MFKHPSTNHHILVGSPGWCQNYFEQTKRVPITEDENEKLKVETVGQCSTFLTEKSGICLWKSNSLRFA